LKVLVLGATGMLGNAMCRLLWRSASLEVYGTLRSESGKRHFDAELRPRLLAGVDVGDFDTVTRAFAIARPDVVINCVGLVKQLAGADDPLAALPINAMLPHRIARLCAVAGARLVHISTDCVFAGTRGNYREQDTPDATDLYGRSKLLGEVTLAHTITLRTSIIGQELDSANGLVGWFLAQQGTVRGFRRAVFSGLPTVELARVVRDHVLPNRALHGLHHVASAPIAKYDLLHLVAASYGKSIDIVPDDSLVIDRSLDATRFRDATGYVAPAWPALVDGMYRFHKTH
jgi:dTDP-4-dehydrorhamnose reductase